MKNISCHGKQIQNAYVCRKDLWIILGFVAC